MGRERDGSANVQVVTEKGMQVFTFKQLHSATGGFGKTNVIGHGGFGSVYRGVLPDGRKIAVKLMDRSGKQGEEEFKMEVRFIYLSIKVDVFPDVSSKMVGTNSSFGLSNTCLKSENTSGSFIRWPYSGWTVD